ncbi:hypothetical protein ABZS93_06615 [Streptomyces sp900116325]|uniref:hypothetical protein n=1 Tax=Streptomyces sp. 900116325 TaxID=3154295 RepID=UPI0033ABE871
MSQPVPPPNQPQQPYDAQPGGGNPFAAQQPGQPGQPGVPTGNPFAGQQPGQPGHFGGVPFTPAAPARNNVALGLLAAVVTALAAAFLYGVIAGAIEREVGYIAVGVGFLVGFAASKVGGQNPVLPVVSALLSIGAVYLGQLVGLSIMLSDLTHTSASGVFFDHFDVVTKGWSESADFKTYLFLVIGAVGAVGGAKKAS